MPWAIDLGETQVAPFTGAWIEIILKILRDRHDFVAPFTGAWIEITMAKAPIKSVRTSHPSRVRGLKFFRKKLLAISI